VLKVRYSNIEAAGATTKLQGLIEAGGDDAEGPFDGEESITLVGI
jgi:2-keto-3-deoxy-L-arabinonate dehydratase